MDNAKGYFQKYMDFDDSYKDDYTKEYFKEEFGKYTSVKSACHLK